MLDFIPLELEIDGSIDGWIAHIPQLARLILFLNCEPSDNYAGIGLGMRDVRFCTLILKIASFLCGTRNFLNGQNNA